MYYLTVIPRNFLWSQNCYMVLDGMGIREGMVCRPSNGVCSNTSDVGDLWSSRRHFIGTGCYHIYFPHIDIHCLHQKQKELQVLYLTIWTTDILIEGSENVTVKA